MPTGLWVLMERASRYIIYGSVHVYVGALSHRLVKRSWLALYIWKRAQASLGVAVGWVCKARTVSDTSTAAVTNVQ